MPQAESTVVAAAALAFRDTRLARGGRKLCLPGTAQRLQVPVTAAAIPVREKLGLLVALTHQLHEQAPLLSVPARQVWVWCRWGNFEHLGCRGRTEQGGTV